MRTAIVVNAGKSITPETDASNTTVVFNKAERRMIRARAKNAASRYGRQLRQLAERRATVGELE